jgi:hypothetical protein
MKLLTPRARAAALWVAILSLLPCGGATAAPVSPLTATPPVVEGRDGWLFLGAELRFLGVGKFWGTAIKKNEGSAAVLKAGGGALPAIVDFNKQLKANGVRLILLPVPPKALISKHAPVADRPGIKADSLGGFYRELAAQGVEVLDLRAVFNEREASGEAMYCKTDSHWSGRGCVVAAEVLAKRVRALLPAGAPGFVQQWKETVILGDLADLLGKKETPGESIPLRQISNAGGDALVSDTDSPLLLVGDSHTLVFREFQGERAGLADQLAFETGIIPEVIGTRGSGANAVRVSLFRRNVKDPRYLASKKVLIWCFAAREFTEADQDWQLIPLNRQEVKVK